MSEKNAIEMPRPLRVLILEDSPSDVELAVMELRRAGYAPEWECVESEEGFLEKLRGDFDIILSDYSMPQFDGLRALALLKGQGLEIPFILVSGTMGEETAVAAMKQGASDYLLKDRLARLGPAVSQALEQSKLRKDRQMAEEATRASEHRFALFMDNLPGFAWIKDEERRYVYANKTLRQLVMSARDWFGKSDDEIWPTELAAKYKATDRQVIESKAPKETIEIILQAEEQRTALISKFPILNDEGEVAFICGIGIDITERKQAEERIRAILESALDCIITMDHQGRITEFNPAAEKTFGYERNKAIGQLLADLIIPPSLRERHHRGLKHYLSTGEAPVLGKHIQLTGMRSDKSEFPVELAIIRIGSQEPPMFTGFIRDITEQKQKEERLREQADIINRAHDAIIVRDFETNRITFWNEGAQRLYGWTAEEALGRSIGELIFADPSQVEALVSAGEFHGEIRQITKDKKELVVDGRATLVRHADGSPHTVLIINTDITEHKKLEMQLLRAQRLESIGTLASGVAHDLNNILAPIMMGAAVLHRTQMPPEDEAILSTIETCAQRGAEVVKQVLTFARGVEGERVTINPSHLVEEIMDIAKKTFPKSVQVSGRYPEDLWPIEGDPTQLHQVLLNLFVNARDAMPAGGTLTISAENFPVDEHYASMMPGAKTGPHVIFEVKDTGMGITPQNMEKIFDPFFTTKELEHGTGLGLSTAIGIVKSHGGFVSVSSEIGRGTTFKVYLPSKVGALETSKKSTETALPRAKGELILVVDDEKPFLQIAQALLEGHGYRVLTAGDGTEALAIFAIQKNEIKLVLTDLAMPLMDGVALIRTLQKMKPDVRVIASTGRGNQKQQAHELADLNVRACLTKPYSKNKLLKTLHEVLNHKTDQS